MKYKLGKLPKRDDRRTFRLSKYLVSLPPLPAVVDWSGHVPNAGPAPWGMMRNDELGDCAVVTPGHMEMAWTSNCGALFVPTDDQIVAAYSAITGYDPANPASDQGAAVLDVLNYWRKSGIAGHRIFAYAVIEPDHADHLRASVALFGGLYIGVQLSQDDMDAFDMNAAWQDASSNELIGGHAIPVIAYDDKGVTCITWGRKQLIGWDWLLKRCDEAYCILSVDWLTKSGCSPAGMNLTQLSQDLIAVSN